MNRCLIVGILLTLASVAPVAQSKTTTMGPIYVQAHNYKDFEEQLERKRRLETLRGF